MYELALISPTIIATGAIVTIGALVYIALLTNKEYV